LAHANYFLTQTAIDDAATPVPITPHFVVDTRSGLILANTVFGAGGPPQLHGEAANALAQFLNVNTRSAGGNAYFAATVNLPAYQPKYLKNANVTQLGIDFLNTLADGAHGGTGDLPWRLPTEAELRGLVAGHTNGGGFAFLNLRWLHWAVWNDSTHAGQANAPWVWASDTRMASLPGLNQGKPFVEQAIVNLNNGSVAWVPIRALHYTNSSTIVPAPQAAVILVSNGGRNYFV
ncbi:MAG: hypothetical protein U0835_19720, partial [Isosphaeraceae bacterium]